MACLVSILALLMFSVISIEAAGESHYETYTYYTTVTKQNCVLRSQNVCNGWWFWRNCWDTYWWECPIVYVNELRIGQKCQTGWTSSYCDIPVCSKSCSGGQVCTAPETCSCVGTTGGLCSSVPCSDDLNCYPGSCDSTACKCSSGFSGTNCLSILKTPDISACQIQLYNSSLALFKEVACEAAQIEPQTTWINANPPRKIQVKWTTNYVEPYSLPDRTYAPHLKNSPVPIGVSETGFTVSGSYKSCTAADKDNPKNTVNCDVPRDWTEFGITPAHNLTFRVDVSSKLGGYKEGANLPATFGSYFAKQYFTGAPITRSARFRFDLVPPVHCLSNPSNDCRLFAIYLEQDVTTNPTIEAKFYNWTDDGSGIFNFHVEVFFMQTNADGFLANVVPPRIQTDTKPDQNNFVYTCTTSGVYSIELTVQDQAGNFARARKLFIFNKDSKLTADRDKLIYVKEADPKNGYKWITKFDNPRNNGTIPLTLVWTEHFSSNAQFNNAWGSPAAPWNIPNGIDDSFKDKYGRRSIYRIDNIPGGIVSYGVSYIIDPNGGGKGLVPQNWMYVNSTVDSYPLPISSLTDGSTIVVWLECTDVAGGSVTEKIVVGVDRTPPSVQEATFAANAVDESTSRMSIKTFDTSSGIRQISFGIYDSKIKNLVYSGSAGPQKRDPPTVQGRRKKRLVLPCTVNDASCYCTPSGDCYNFVQTVDIDNCWLDRLPGHTFEFRFTVTNGANLTSSEKTESLGELNLDCRRDQLPIAGIVVGCILGFLVLVALIIVIVLFVRVYVFKKPMPSRLANAQQTISNKFSRPQLDENIAYTSSDDLHPNNTQQVTSKPNKWKPATKLSNVDETYVYSSGNGQNNYTYNTASGGGVKVIPKKQLKLGETIAEGRFAVIKKAQLTLGNEETPAVTKGLTRGFSVADANLMADKIAFQSKIPSHVNILKFIGRLDDAGDNGPIMVLEHCEISLKDWLKKLDRINSEVLDDMLTFTLNIANGVNHLHENQVVHRRLGARNVLLKEQYGGLVAKLIGFGPNREDKDGSQASLPIKWLAPETLETLKKGSPTYDKSSDAWSFGITIWEIYSKGEVPYSDLQTDKVKKLLTKDKRMVLIRPEECPVELFTNVITPCWNFTASRRPSSAEICSQVEAFRKGTGLEPMGYYTSNQRGYETYSEPSEGTLYDDAA